MGRERNRSEGEECLGWAGRTIFLKIALLLKIDEVRSNINKEIKDLNNELIKSTSFHFPPCSSQVHHRYCSLPVRRPMILLRSHHRLSS